LLGRGSNCINTAGEKVFPEEVEEALKTHPSVDDALVLGVPDEKWGQAVTGVVLLVNGSRFDEEQLRTHVRTQLAGYKTPKRILIAGVALRAPNGKADYKAVGEFARQDLVDEYQVFVHPVALGGGSPLFPSPAKRQGFSLRESRVFDDTVVGLRYARART